VFHVAEDLMRDFRHIATPLFTATALFLSSLANRSVSAQVDSALALFPMSTGNVWQYHYQYWVHNWKVGPSKTYEQWVQGDSILPNGKIYKIFLWRHQYPGMTYSRRLLRVDSATACVYEYVEGSTGEKLVDSLRASRNDRLGSESSMVRSMDVRVDTVLGVVTAIKRFGWESLGHGRWYEYALGIGMSLQAETCRDCRMELGTADIYDVIYAKVDGREYGTYVSVEKHPETLPSSFVLEQNYPNPFNSTTTFNIFVPQAQSVSLEVFSSLGQVVARLYDGVISAGWHSIPWDAHGHATGLYICRLRTVSGALSRKLLLLQ
jgi:hypothetical protein